jgi:hypothetical protein
MQHVFIDRIPTSINFAEQVNWYDRILNNRILNDRILSYQSTHSAKLTDTRILSMNTRFSLRVISNCVHIPKSSLLFRDDSTSGRSGFMRHLGQLTSVEPGIHLRHTNLEREQNGVQAPDVVCSLFRLIRPGAGYSL